MIITLTRRMKLRQAHIRYTGKNLDFKTASELAVKYADKEIIDPIMVAWQDWNLSRMSPALSGCETNFCWHDYGANHGGKLELFVNGEYDFIFADSSAFEPYGPSPYANLKDAFGNEYLCQINALRDPHNPSEEACVILDEWTCKLT